jgi:hypothetical protein
MYGDIAEGVPSVGSPSLAAGGGGRGCRDGLAARGDSQGMPFPALPLPCVSVLRGRRGSGQRTEGQDAS